MEPTFHCGLQELRSRRPSPPGALLLPKLRSYFAEFLSDGSLERLRIFISPTCVGLRYGRSAQCCEAFLVSMASMTSAHNRPPHQLSGYVKRGFTYASPYCLGPGRLPPGSPSLLHPSSAPPNPKVQGDTDRYRNIDLLSIDYAFRPRLRIRLTLGGFAFPRKPWAYGERDSHPFSRYSCPHTH